MGCRACSLGSSCLYAFRSGASGALAQKVIDDVLSFSSSAFNKDRLAHKTRRASGNWTTRTTNVSSSTERHTEQIILARQGVPKRRGSVLKAPDCKTPPRQTEAHKGHTHAHALLLKVASRIKQVVGGHLFVAVAQQERLEHALVRETHRLQLFIAKKKRDGGQQCRAQVEGRKGRDARVGSPRSPRP